MYRVIINYCPIAVGVGDVLEYARLAAHPKPVWVFNANYDVIIICSKSGKVKFDNSDNCKLP
jgi:hypothetical protein